MRMAITLFLAFAVPLRAAGLSWPCHAIIGVETGSQGFECVPPEFNGDDFCASPEAVGNVTRSVCY